MFKVGDRIRLINYPNTGTVVSVVPNGVNVHWDGGAITGPFSCESLELITPAQPDKSMNIKESFVLALTSEPKKSFRKAGVTNGDDLLTDEGQKIFLTWLLHSKYADEFKTSVVDGLLADEKK